MPEWRRLPPHHRGVLLPAGMDGKKILKTPTTPPNFHIFTSRKEKKTRVANEENEDSKCGLLVARSNEKHILA